MKLSRSRRERDEEDGVGIKDDRREEVRERGRGRAEEVREREAEQMKLEREAEAEQKRLERERLSRRD